MQLGALHNPGKKFVAREVGLEVNLRINISIPGVPGNQSLSALTGGTGDWGNFFEGNEFVVNSSETLSDIWFVIEGPHGDKQTETVETGIVVFLTAETSYPPNYFYDRSGGEAFLAQFDYIYTCHDIFGPNVTRDYPFLAWWINSNHGSVFSSSGRDYQWLQAAQVQEKTKEFSVICSSQSFTPFHRLRLRFVEELKNHFGNRMDWFGNGVRPVKEKWEALAPYKYNLAIENQIAPLLLTEKLQDPLLTFTFPFYVGAPDAQELFGQSALEPLDIRDPASAIDKIEEAMAKDLWSARLGAIQKARSIVLSDHHLLRRIGRIADNLITGRNRYRASKTIWAKDSFVRRERIAPHRLLARKAGNRLLRWAQF